MKASLRGGHTPITKREAEVMVLVADGLTAKEIGVRLNVSESTVKRYQTSVYGKLGVTNNIESLRAMGFLLDQRTADARVVEHRALAELTSLLADLDAVRARLVEMRDGLLESFEPSVRERLEPIA